MYAIAACVVIERNICAQIVVERTMGQSVVAYIQKWNCFVCRVSKECVVYITCNGLEIT